MPWRSDLLDPMKPHLSPKLLSDLFLDQPDLTGSLPGLLTRSCVVKFVVINVPIARFIGIDNVNEVMIP
jgi:hypothetical protein